MDLEAYRPERGLAGHDLARAHHDARDHAAAVIQLIERLGPGAALGEPSAVRALAQLAESQLRAELAAEHYRREAKPWLARYNEALEQMAQMRGESEARRAREPGWRPSARPSQALLRLRPKARPRSCEPGAFALPRRSPGRSIGCAVASRVCDRSQVSGARRPRPRLSAWFARQEEHLLDEKTAVLQDVHPLSQGIEKLDVVEAQVGFRCPVGL